MVCKTLGLGKGNCEQVTSSYMERNSTVEAIGVLRMYGEIGYNLGYANDHVG